MSSVRPLLPLRRPARQGGSHFFFSNKNRCILSCYSRARCVLTRQRNFLNMNPTVAKDAARSWDSLNMIPTAARNAARCGELSNWSPTATTNAARSWECSNMNPAATPDASRSRECATTARAPNQQPDGPRLALHGRRPNNRNLHHQHRHRPQTQLLFQATLSGVFFFF